MDQSSPSLALLGGSFSKLLAHATLDLFPGTQLAEDWVQGSLFCYKFILKQKIEALDLKVIEGRIAEIQNKNPEFHIMEMIPKNAAELFKAQNQRKLELLMRKSSAPTVKVVKVDHFYDLDRFGVLLNVQKKSFKLLSYEIQEESKKTCLLITGAAHNSQKELKEFFKDYKAQSKHSHIELGREMDLFNDKLLLPGAVQIIDSIKGEINENFKRAGFSEIIPIDSAEGWEKKVLFSNASSLHSKYFLWSKKEKKTQSPLEKGLFQIKIHTSDEWISVTNLKRLEKECISYLNFYKQIIKILGFSYRVKCKAGKCPKLVTIMERAFEETGEDVEPSQSDHFEVYFEVMDHYKRTVLRPSFRVEKWALKEGESSFVISGSFCSSLEMLFAYLLEHCKGNLPVKWLGEQLKILALNHKLDFAKEVYDYFKNNNIRVSLEVAKRNLKECLQNVCKKRVPYVALIGEREQKQKKLTVKMQRVHKEIECFKEQLLDRLLEELKQR